MFTLTKSVCQKQRSEMFYKKAVHRKTPVLKSLFNKAAELQLFSCEYWKIFKDTLKTFDNFKNKQQKSMK